ncbi:MAG: response regulator transcription factor [Pleomorphochaeta sp.]
MNTVLIVDDEKAIVQMLSINLKNFGYKVLKAYDGFDALELLSYEKVDVVLLDIMMPNMDGITVCNKIKENSLTRAIPVIFLSAKTQVEDKIIGLNNGADDYITKPFDLNELKSRIDAVIRRVETLSNQNNIISKGDIKIDLSEFRVFCNSNELELTLTEFKILSELVKIDNSLDKNRLTRLIYNDESYQNKRVLDVHIRNLRRKLDDYNSSCKIVTLRGIGYILEIKQD